eukprot:1136829-Pelagomonas_calceolata.AAC.2
MSFHSKVVTGKAWKGKRPAACVARTRICCACRSQATRSGTCSPSGSRRSSGLHRKLAAMLMCTCLPQLHDASEPHFRDLLQYHAPLVGKLLDDTAEPHFCNLQQYHAPLVGKLVVPEVHQLQRLVLALEQLVQVGLKAANEVIAQVQALQA